MLQDLWQKLGYNFSDPTAAWLTEGDKEFAELVHEMDFSRFGIGVTILAGIGDYYGRFWTKTPFSKMLSAVNCRNSTEFLDEILSWRHFGQIFYSFVYGSTNISVFAGGIWHLRRVSSRSLLQHFFKTSQPEKFPAAPRHAAMPRKQQLYLLDVTSDRFPR